MGRLSETSDIKRPAVTSKSTELIKILSISVADDLEMWEGLVIKGKKLKE